MAVENNQMNVRFRQDLYTLAARNHVWTHLLARHGIVEAGRVMMGCQMQVASGKEEVICFVNELDDDARETLANIVATKCDLHIYSWDKTGVEQALSSMNVQASVQVLQLKRVLH